MSQHTQETGAGSAQPVQVQFDPTPPLGQDVLALFRGPFAGVRFPDVDRDSLEADAHALLLCQAETEALEQSLEDARQRTRDAAAHLQASAARALAYARVFAMGQPELEGALDAVRGDKGEPGVGERGPKKRRGRPPKEQETEPESLLLLRRGGEQLPIEASPSHDPSHDQDQAHAAE